MIIVAPSSTLARLHDRFWGLSEDLSVYPWLGHPLTRNFEACTMASARAMELIIARGSPALITESLNITTCIAHALSHADEIAQALRATPPTLLHGDYWPATFRLMKTAIRSFMIGKQSASVRHTRSCLIHQQQRGLARAVAR